MSKLCFELPTSLSIHSYKNNSACFGNHDSILWVWDHSDWRGLCPYDLQVNISINICQTLWHLHCSSGVQYDKCTVGDYCKYSLMMERRSLLQIFLSSLVCHKRWQRPQLSDLRLLWLRKHQWRPVCLPIHWLVWKWGQWMCGTGYLHTMVTNSGFNNVGNNQWNPHKVCDCCLWFWILLLHQEL